jgi:hypothetical protein
VDRVLNVAIPSQAKITYCAALEAALLAEVEPFIPFVGAGHQLPDQGAPAVTDTYTILQPFLSLEYIPSVAPSGVANLFGTAEHPERRSTPPQATGSILGPYLNSVSVQPLAYRNQLVQAPESEHFDIASCNHDSEIASAYPEDEEVLGEVLGTFIAVSSFICELRLALATCELKVSEILGHQQAIEAITHTDIDDFLDIYDGPDVDPLTLARIQSTCVEVERSMLTVISELTASSRAPLPSFDYDFLVPEVFDVNYIGFKTAIAALSNAQLDTPILVAKRALHKLRSQCNQLIVWDDRALSLVKYDPVTDNSCAFSPKLGWTMAPGP